MKIIPTKKLNIICGHYGSGKTNLAVNMAISTKREQPNAEVYLADLDIVNPYFRSADAAELLKKHGVNVLIPEFANTNVDIPSLPPRLAGLITTPGENDIVFVDVGGDDGAVALGMYNTYIKEGEYDLYYVINMYRPLTETPEDTYSCMQEIEALSRLKCTKIINNSSLGADTTENDIVATVEYAKASSNLCDIPILAHSYCHEFAPNTPESFVKAGYASEPLFEIELATKKLF